MTTVLYPVSDTDSPAETAHPARRLRAAPFGAARWPSAPQLLGLTAHRPRTGTRIVTVAGEVDLFTTPLLEATLRAQLASGPAHLTLNLEHARFFAACGLSCLLRIQDLVAHTSRTQLHLAGLDNRAVARALQVTGLIEQFDTYLTLADALAATT